MKSITDLENLNNQIVLLRLDLNVPILDGKITDTNRIDKIIDRKSTRLNSSHQ